MVQTGQRSATRAAVRASPPEVPAGPLSLRSPAGTPSRSSAGRRDASGTAAKSFSKRQEPRGSAATSAPGAHARAIVKTCGSRSFRRLRAGCRRRVVDELSVREGCSGADEGDQCGATHAMLSRNVGREGSPNRTFQPAAAVSRWRLALPAEPPRGFGGLRGQARTSGHHRNEPGPVRPKSRPAIRPGTTTAVIRSWEDRSGPSGPSY
jgi:hypothetical protein